MFFSPSSSFSSSPGYLVFSLHLMSLVFPRSSGVWVSPLCCPVYLTLCPVCSEETKQRCLPLTSSQLFCFLLWLCGILLLEGWMNVFNCGMEALKDTFPPDPTGCLDVLGVACFLLVELFLWLGDVHTVFLLGYFLVLLLVTVVLHIDCYYALPL